MISERFQEQINAHLLGNMLPINKYPLILGIMGRPGMGKTWQLREHLKSLEFEVFSINAADLESNSAGVPAKLLKEEYVKASISIGKNIPAAIVIDDIDTTVGEWERNTGTVNHQGILAFLMHIVDNPCEIESIGKVNRVPIFFTGNKFELLYEPLRRPGRMLRFDWEPTKEEKVDIVSSCLLHIDNPKKIASDLVDIYPNNAVSFFTTLISTKKLEVLSKIASTAAFKCMLEDENYKRNLINMYNIENSSINWENEIEKIREVEKGANNSN